MAATRLLTLTGPPGVGKSRLAVAAAEDLRSFFSDGVMFVDLTRVAGPESVSDELVRAAGLAPATGRDAERRLASWLSTKRLLLVVDNVDHVRGFAPSLAALLGAHPRLRMLATCRERLRLSAEHELVVPPLPMPERADVADLSRLASNPAVAVLVSRARAVLPDFALTRENAVPLSEICIRLDGMPLALELASARLKVFSPEQLLERLDHQLSVLTGGVADAEPRHRTMRAAIEWSHALVPADERAVLRRSAVFIGGWTIDDAVNVCGEGVDEVTTPLCALVDKSLVRRTTRPDGATEFSMTDAVHEFAAEQLGLHGETATLQARHAEWFAEQASRVEADMGTRRESDALAWVGNEHANLLSALEVSVQAGRSSSMFALAAALGWYWYTQGRIAHASVVLRDAFAAAERSAETEQRTGCAGALVVAGILAFANGDLVRADRLLHTSARFDRPHNWRRLAIGQAFLGHIARGRGHHRAAMAHHRQAEGLFTRLGDARGLAWSHHDLALDLCELGDHGGARPLLDEATRTFRDLHYPWAVATCACALGSVLLRLDSIDEATPLLAEAIHAHLGWNDSRGLAQCLEAFAGVAMKTARLVTAAQLLAAAGRLRSDDGAPLTGEAAASVEAIENDLTRLLDPDALHRARDGAHGMSAEEAVALALSLAPAAGAREPVLTPRERQVAALVATGRTNRQVARALGIREKTVASHVANIMSKLRAGSRAEIAARAIREGLRYDVG